MTDPRAAARLWAGRSVFDADAAHESSPVPFALVAAGPSSGRDVGRPPSALPARPALGLKGMPSLRVPLLLDAAPVGEGSSKAWAAIARGASLAGAALLATVAQVRQREAVLKASGVPLVLRAAPGNPIPPEAGAASGAIAYALASADGAPAVMADDALPGLIESLCALTQYRAPVILLAPPGRVPSAGGLRAAASAGAAAICMVEGEGLARLPLPALFGHALSVRALGLPLGAFPASDALSDGVGLACALAAGGGFAATALPLRLAVAEESATDADWKVTGDRLGHALRVLWEDAQRAAAIAGVRDPRDLSPENLRALTYDAAALSGLKLAGYEERLPWWTH